MNRYLPGYKVGVIKAANQSVTNSTTPVNDTHLTFSVGAGQSWEVEFHLFTWTSGGSSDDIKFQVVGPANSAGWTGGWGLRLAATSEVNRIKMAAVPLGTAISYGVASGYLTYVVVRATITTTDTAGDVHLQWAQNVGSGSAMTVCQNSWMMATRLVDDGAHVYAVQAADLSIYGNSTYGDTDLAFTVAPGETWAIEYGLFVEGGPQGDKFTLKVPSANTLWRIDESPVLYMSGGVVEYYAMLGGEDADYPTNAGGDTIVGTPLYQQLSGVVRALVDGGTVRLGFAAWSTIYTVTLKAGSWMRATHIG